MSHISRVMPTSFSSLHKNCPDGPTSSCLSRFSSNPGDCAQTNISLPSTVPLIFLIPGTSFRGQYSHPSLEDHLAVAALRALFARSSGDTLAILALTDFLPNMAIMSLMNWLFEIKWDGLTSRRSNAPLAARPSFRRSQQIERLRRNSSDGHLHPRCFLATS